MSFVTPSRPALRASAALQTFSRAALMVAMATAGCASNSLLDSGPTTRGAHAQAQRYEEGAEGRVRALTGPTFDVAATPGTALGSLAEAGQPMAVDRFQVDHSGRATLEGKLSTGAEVTVHWRVDPSVTLAFTAGDAIVLQQIQRPDPTALTGEPGRALIIRDGAGLLLAVLSAGLPKLADLLPAGTEITLSPKAAYTESQRQSSLCIASQEHRALRVRHDGGITYLPPGRWADLSLGGHAFRLVAHDGPVPLGRRCPESAAAAPHFTLTRLP